MSGLEESLFLMKFWGLALLRLDPRLYSLLRIITTGLRRCVEPQRNTTTIILNLVLIRHAWKDPTGQMEALDHHLRQQQTLAQTWKLSQGLSNCKQIPIFWISLRVVNTPDTINPRSLLYIYLFVCLFQGCIVRGGTRAMTPVWRSEDHLKESILSLYHVSSKDGTQAVGAWWQVQSLWPMIEDVC